MDEYSPGRLVILTCIRQEGQIAVGLGSRQSAGATQCYQQAQLKPGLPRKGLLGYSFSNHLLLTCMLLLF